MLRSRLSLCISAALAALLTVPQTVFAAPYACGDDIRIFNTGVDASLARITTLGTPDPRWKVANKPVDDVTTLGVIAAWDTPVTARLGPPNGWTWADVPTAAWLARNTEMSAAKYTYYKLDVDLAASVNPATFQVHTTTHAADQVVAVFLNGQLLPGSQLADSWAGGVHVSVPSTFTIANQWRTGANELVVQVFNNSATVNPASARKWGGFALEASTASCTTRPAATTVAPVPATHPLALVIGGLLVAGIGMRVARRQAG